MGNNPQFFILSSFPDHTKGQNTMKDILKQLNTRPKLFEQSTASIWDDPHISKGMLKAHLNENQESATRKLDFVKKSVAWINTVLPNHHYNNLLDLGCGPGIYAGIILSVWLSGYWYAIYQNGQSVMLKLRQTKRI